MYGVQPELDALHEVLVVVAQAYDACASDADWGWLAGALRVSCSGRVHGGGGGGGGTLWHVDVIAGVPVEAGQGGLHVDFVLGGVSCTVGG